MWPIIIDWIIALCFGLIVGSFLNAVIYRVPRKISMIRPRSSCPACNHVLGAIDLVPVFSYLCLRGHCRHCGSKIPERYLLIELITGVLFLISYLVWAYSLLTVIAWLIIAVLGAAAGIRSEKVHY